MVATLPPTVVEAQQSREEAQLASEAYRTLSLIEDPIERLKAIDEFVEKYPDSPLAPLALRTGIRTAAGIDSLSALAIDYAERAIEAAGTPDREANTCMWAALALFNAKIWPEKASEYAERARQGLRDDAPPVIKANTLGVVARVKDWLGNTEEAVSIQREVIEHNPEDFQEVSALGYYLFRVGKHDEAEGYLIRGLLNFPYHLEAIDALDKLSAQNASPGVSAEEYKESAVREGIDAMLSESDDLLLVKQTLAVSLAELGILTDRAIEFAGEIVRDTGRDLGYRRYIDARIQAAWAYRSLGDYGKVLEVLDPIKRPASSSLSFNSLRGQALKELGRKEEAIEAYLKYAESSGFRTIPRDLRPLWEEVYGRERDLDETIESLRSEEQPWHVGEQYEVSPDWEGRVVLAELFTGSECGPCVAADLAYDGLIEYFPRTANAILVYHVHIPGPDPMTNTDTEARMAYYTRDVVRGTPTSIINGISPTVGGGGESAAEGRYWQYSWEIEEELKTAPKMDIDLSGKLKDRSVSVSAVVSDIDPSLRENSGLKLRVVLAEKLLHYEGGNGIGEHRMVVRAFFGGHDGFSLRTDRAKTKVRSELDLEELEASLLSYLDEWESTNSDRFRGDPGFKEKMHEIDEGQLLLVAFVQDDTSKEVLQVRIIELN